MIVRPLETHGVCVQGMVLSAYCLCVYARARVCVCVCGDVARMRVGSDKTGLGQSGVKQGRGVAGDIASPAFAGDVEP